MSTGLRNSTIETFRRRYHADNILLLYKVVGNGDTITLLQTVTAGFYLGQNTDVTEGAAPYLLTIDIPFTPGLTDEMIRATKFIELNNPVTDVTKRYKVDALGPPAVNDWRYVLAAHAAFNDEKEIV